MAERPLGDLRECLALDVFAVDVEAVRECEQTLAERDAMVCGLRAATEVAGN